MAEDSKDSPRNTAQRLLDSAPPSISTRSEDAATPKNQSKLGSSSDLSPTRFRGFQEGESPRADEADYKRYEQLAKICSQMREKEAELNSKQQNLEAVGQRNRDLERQLTQLTESAKKHQNPNESSSMHEIRQTVTQKNSLIESIENEINQLNQDQKQRVTSDELVISGCIKRVTGLESQISQTAKKSTLATNKLLELQTKVLGEAPAGVLPEQQAILQGIDEKLQKVRAQVHTVRMDNSSLVSELGKKAVEQKNQDSRVDTLKKQYWQQLRQVSQLQKDIEVLKSSNQKQKKLADIERLRKDTEQQFKAKLAKASEASNTSTAGAAPSAKTLEDLKKKLRDLEKEDKPAELTTYQNTLESNRKEVESLTGQLKKEKEQQTKELTPEEIAVKELQKEIDALKKEHKQLKSEEKELMKDNAPADLQALKKKVSKREGAATPENIDVLRTARDKLEKEMQEIRALYRGLEKEQKNHAPAPLIEDYKKKVAEKQAESALSQELATANVDLKKEFEELYQRKEAIQWEKNPIIEELDQRGKSEQQRIEELTELNKTSAKKLAQVTTKCNEYKAAYPDFELPKKSKGKQQMKVEPKKEEKKEDKKAPTAMKKQTSGKSDPQTPKLEEKKGKKNKGGANGNVEQYAVPEVVEEVYVTEEQPREEPALEKVALTEQSAGKKKKGKKGVATSGPQIVTTVIEEKPKPPVQLPPQQPSELEEIERHIMQAAAETSPAEDEVERPSPNKKSNKKQDKKKTGKSKAVQEDQSIELQSSILSNLPGTKTQSSTEAYKAFVLPAAVLLVLAVVFMMLR